MENGITAKEACLTRSLTAEDFARMCNQDGSLKADNTVLVGWLFMGLFLVAIVVAVFLLKRAKRKK